MSSRHRDPESRRSPSPALPLPRLPRPRFLALRTQLRSRIQPRRLRPRLHPCLPRRPPFAASGAINPVAVSAAAAAASSAQAPATSLASASTPVAAPPQEPIDSPAARGQFPVSFSAVAALIFGAGASLGLLSGALLMRQWLLRGRLKVGESAPLPTLCSTSAARRSATWRSAAHRTAVGRTAARRATTRRSGAGRTAARRTTVD